jgi:flagellar hook-associated protein 2
LGLTEDLKIRVSDGAQTNIITLSASDKLSDVITDIEGIGNLTISFDTTKSKFDITSTASPKQKIKIEAVDTGQSEMLDKIGLKTTNVNKLTKLSDLGITTDSTVQVNDGSTKATVTLKADMTVGEFQAELAKAMPNASVGFDETAGSFFISSRKTGASQAISMEVKTGSDMPNLLSKLGLATAGQSSLSVQGSDSLFTYNGVTMQTDSNTATVNGMKLTLKATTNTEVDINVTADTEATVKFVNDFVTEYNKLIDDAYTGLKADSASKYKPLTAEQKETMSEDDIKLWEKKIKDSLLRRDAPLTKVVDNMRTSLSGVVEGNAFKNLAAIGITTGDWTQNGKLEISEEKLRAAVNENSEAVIALFAKGGDPKTAYLDANKESTAADYDSLTATEKEKWVQKTTGLGQRLYTGLYDQFKAITDTKTATSIFNDITIQDQIDDAEEDVDTLNDKLSNMEDIYYKRFTAMEKMMSQLNNQSNWLTQQLGGSN